MDRLARSPHQQHAPGDLPPARLQDVEYAAAIGLLQALQEDSPQVASAYASLASANLGMGDLAAAEAPVIVEPEALCDGVIHDVLSASPTWRMNEIV